MNDSDFILRVQAQTGWDDAEMARKVGYARRTIQRVRTGQMELTGKLQKNALQAMEAAGFGDLRTQPADNLENAQTPSLAVESPNVAGYKITLRRVSVLSMARAGFLTSYEELPIDWQDSVPSDCPDPKAFGLRIEGDSMEDSYHAGDVVIVMPSFVPYPDSLVVAKLRSGDVMFKHYSVLDSRGKMIRLASENPRYGPRDLSLADIEWIYPVYGHVRTTWHEDRWKLHRKKREEDYEHRQEEVQFERDGRS